MIGQNERELIREILKAVEEKFSDRAEFPLRLKKNLRREIIIAIADYKRASFIDFLSSRIISEEFAWLFKAMKSERGLTT